MERRRKTLLSAGKWALAIVPAGIALGALLGGDPPEPKEPPAAWWQLTGREDIAIAAGGRPFVEAGPEDLGVRGGYRPDLDYAAEVWTLPVPEHDLAVLLEEAPADDWPRVTYGVTEVEDTAEAAEAAAAAALAAQQPEPEPTPAPEVRKSELALAGIY